MAGLGSLLPRFVALPLVALLGTATLTFAAEKQLSAPSAPAQPAAAQVPQVIVVPDVRRQAYVFAKGTLEDAGFAWRVVGSVKGFAANTVSSQSPAPGTRVVDTGAPPVSLTLSANSRYVQKGTPENAAPYAPTSLKVAGAAAAVAAPAPATETTAQPAPKPKAASKPKQQAAPAAKRPPSFAVPGAPKEPLDEIPLVDRAKQLAKYVEAHPDKSAAVVNHFLYQHAWIVTGARFGWWRGAEALEVLIRVDERVQAVWGIGGKSESLARAALAYVQAQSR